MNIFVLDTNPVKAAEYHCDKHVVKMVLESAQLLCGVHEPGTAPYRRTHYNHPSAKWARATEGNYLWLCDLSMALCQQYTFRYGKTHKSQEILEWCRANIPLCESPTQNLTPFALAMPEAYKDPIDAVKSYRTYYARDKVRIATWRKGVPEPLWWQEYLKNA